MLAILQAVDQESTAYKAGHSAGMIFAIVIIGGFILIKAFKWLRNR